MGTSQIKRLSAFIVLCSLSCSHVKSYEQATRFPVKPYSNLQVYLDQRKNTVEVSGVLDLKDGETFQVPAEPIRIRYENGEEEKAHVLVTSIQARAPVAEKYPARDGYQVAQTGTPGVWKVQKATKVVMRVIVDADEFTYDGRSQEEPLQLGKFYLYQDPEDAYVSREIVYRASFPNRKKNFEIEGFKVAVDAITYPPKSYKYEYSEKWKKWEMIP